MSAVTPSGDAKLSTWALLLELGFTVKPDCLCPTLSYDFGNLTLDAGEVVTDRFAPVIQLTGVFGGARSFGMIEYQVPRELDSREQGLALLAYCLDHHAGNPTFRPQKPASWLDAGRLHQGLLPWERAAAVARAEYESCPRCWVDREWLRLGLKTLNDRLAEMKDADCVSFDFDGEQLAIHATGKRILLPAEGDAWPKRCTVPVASLRQLPKRLRRAHVVVEVDKAGLVIDRNVFPLGA